MHRKAKTPVSILDYSILSISCLILLLSYAVAMIFTAPHAWAAGNMITVHITGSKHPPGFRPYLVTVHINDTIVFLNDAQPEAIYRLTADDQSFVSPPIESGQQWSMTISTPGTYEYHTLNTTPRLVGAIVVVPSSIKLLSPQDPGLVATEISVDRTGGTQSSGPPAPAAPVTSTTIDLILVTFALVLVSLTVSIVLFLSRRRRV